MSMTDAHYRKHLALLLDQELQRKRPELNGKPPAAIACSARELVALDDDADTSQAEAGRPAQSQSQPTPAEVFVLSSFGASRPFSPDEIDTVVSRRIELRKRDGRFAASLRLEPLDARVGPRE